MKANSSADAGQGLGKGREVVWEYQTHPVGPNATKFIGDFRQEKCMDTVTSGKSLLSLKGRADRSAHSRKGGETGLMDTIEFKRKGGKTHALLGSHLDVAGVADLYENLDRALKKRKPPFVLDCSRVERIDTAVLQLLLAFVKEARAKGEFSWGEVSSYFKGTAELAGFHGALGL